MSRSGKNELAITIFRIYYCESDVFVVKGSRYEFEENRCFGDTWGQLDVVC
jgi:hypothetical protein